MCKKSALTLIVVSSLFVVAAPLQATLYPLVIFNNATLADDPSLSFYVDVLDAGTDKVDFVFHNKSAIDSTITKVYFDDDDGLLSDIPVPSITNGPGTIFHWDATHAILPSGETLTPSFDADFSASANPPPAQNGVDPTEWVKITFDIDGHTFPEVIEQINDGTMRIGAHIISIPVVGGENVSVSAVTVTSATTPEPATIALLGLSALSLLRKHPRK